MTRVLAKPRNGEEVECPEGWLLSFADPARPEAVLSRQGMQVIVAAGRVRAPQGVADDALTFAWALAALLQGGTGG